MTNNDEIEIDLLKILKTCLKKAWIILLAAVILGGAMFIYADKSYVPAYSTSTTLYASYTNSRDFAFGDNSGNISQNSLSESRNIVNTCLAMLKTRMTLDAVIEESGVDINAATLQGMFSAAAVNNSEVFTITVNGTNPVQIIQLANAFAKVLPEHVAMLNSNNNITIIDEAVEATVTNSSGAVKKAALAAILGACAACCVIAVPCMVEDIKSAKKKEN